MISKILSKIRIHFFFYIVTFIVVLTGFFKEFIIFTIIILVHEIGHIIGALIYKWKIDKIIILPFGGLTIFNEKLNRPIKEELLIALLGPIVQILCFSFFSDKMVLQYHYSLLFFNLLPIFPLDGSKIFNILLCKVMSFKTSYLISLWCSLILCLGLFTIIIIRFDLLLLLIVFFLFYKCLYEFRIYKSIFNRFLMERFIYKFHFKKEKIITGMNFNSFFRDYRHLFYVDNSYYSEREMLRKRFDK